MEKSHYDKYVKTSKKHGLPPIIHRTRKCNKCDRPYPAEVLNGRVVFFTCKECNHKNSKVEYGYNQRY